MDLDRRAFLAALAAAGAGAALPRAVSALSPGNQPHFSSLAGRSLIFDSFGAPELGVLGHGGRGVLNGRGLTAVHVGLASQSFEAARGALAEWERRFRRQPGELVKILAAEDIERSGNQGRLGILLGFANAACIDDNVDNLYALYASGARAIQLADESRELPQNACNDASNAELSDFGVGVVETMNELGMVVDLSLCGEATSRYGIQISRKPPAFTHASCRALHAHRRAKSDELLRAIAERGGMIGIHPGDDQSSEEHLDHITHAINVAGVDHVGIASSSGASSPRSRVSFLTLALGLERRRYRSEDIEKLLGENWNCYLREAL
ncbi:MAG TPA: membrane dipeptidase [Vicinamibacteria bacterium]